MKILHTADWHVGKPLRGRSRLDEYAAALDEVTAGKSVTTAETKPYGCSVKYAK